MNKTIIAAVASCFISPVFGQGVLLGSHIEVPAHVGMSTGTPGIANGFMKFQTTDRSIDLMKINADGSISFFWNATIDFSADSYTNVVGIHAGFVWVRVGGQHYLMPIYSPARGLPQ